MQSNRISRTLFSCCTTILMLLLWGCRTHPELIRDARRNLAQGNREGVIGTFPKKIDPDDKNGLLYLSERSRLNHDLGNFQASNADIITIQNYERHVEETEAKIRLSAATEQTEALLTNDEALPYRLCDYERNMLFQTAGFNVLHDNPMELPAVISNLTALQEKLRRQSKVRTASLENQLGNIEGKKNQQSMKALQNNNVFLNHQKNANRISKKLPGFENAYSYYFCGLYFETQNDRGSALIAYQMAYLLVPQNQFFRDSFIRMARQTGRKDLLERYRLTDMQLPPPSPNTGDVIIFYEGGWLPEKLPYKLSVPVYTGGTGFILVNLSFPYYAERQDSQPPLAFSIDGKSHCTQEAANLHHFAVRHLQDQMPGIITRMFLRASGRALASYAASQAIQNIDDPTTQSVAMVAHLFAQAGMAEMERPDLRSFLSLPHTLQIARFSLPAGRHKLRFSSHGRIGESILELLPGEKRIYQVIAAPEFLCVHEAKMPHVNELPVLLHVKENTVRNSPIIRK